MATFEFTFLDDTPEIAPYALGDLTITGTEGSATSKDDPRYLMMVVISLLFLVDQVSSFLVTPSQRKLEFIGTDGSFKIHFSKSRDDMIVIRVFDQVVSREDRTEFVQELWRSVQTFVEHYWHRLQTGHSEVSDLHHCIYIYFMKHSMVFCKIMLKLFFLKYKRILRKNCLCFSVKMGYVNVSFQRYMV
jgi:hypothetical protein